MPRGGRRTAGPGKRIGREPKPIAERIAWKGKIAIRVTPETAARAQRLMLHFPDVPTVEALFEYALVKLAETTE
jgi:hypothetical protein